MHHQVMVNQLEHEVTKGSLQESVELLTKRNNEIDLKLKMTESDYAKDMERLHEKVQELEELRG